MWWWSSQKRGLLGWRVIIIIIIIIIIIMLCMCALNAFSQNDVGECAQQVVSLESQLSSRMQQLHATVQSKNAVPTAQVYVSIAHYMQ